MKPYNADREFRKHLKEELFPKLKTAYKSKKFKIMGDLLGDFTVITHPDGHRSQGSDNISHFFEHEGEKKDKIEFDLICSYACEVSNHIEEENQKLTDILHVGHAIFEFTGCYGRGTLSFFHPRSCVWEP